jgi:hypothetical protein
LGGDPGSMERESALLSLLVQMDGIHGALEQVQPNITWLGTACGSCCSHLAESMSVPPYASRSSLTVFHLIIDSVTVTWSRPSHLDTPERSQQGLWGVSTVLPEGPLGLDCKLTRACCCRC